MNPKLYLKSGYGVGNRLRTLHSFSLLAEIYQLELQLCWPHFNNFWTNSLTLIPNSIFHDLFFGESSIPKFGSVSHESPIKHTASGKVVSFLKKTRESVVVSTGTALSSRCLGLSPKEFQQNKKDFYKNLALTEPLKRCLQDSLSRFNGGCTAGLQFRGGDALRIGRSAGLQEFMDQSVPHLKKYSTIYATSNDSAFIPSLKKKFPDKKILCTPRPAVTPDKEITYKRNNIGLPKEPIQLEGGAFWENLKFLELMKSDLLDWYALASCDIVFHSRQSSFGIEAGVLSGTSRAIA